jgi:alpha-amylase
LRLSHYDDGRGSYNILYIGIMKKMFIAILLLPLLFFACSCEKPVGPVNPGENDTSLVVTEDFRVVKPTPKEWDEVKRGAISYQMLMYSFADKNGDGWGDIQGLTDKLDYIDNLGISAIWISPIHPCMSYHGYDVTDYSALNPRFGTMSDFNNLIQQAHQRGIKIYLDYVINHTGKDHPWFKEAYSSADNLFRDYFIFSENPQNDITAGKIPMIATEGSSGYDAGQWFSISSTTKTKYLFTLDWTQPSAPTITVTSSNTVDSDNADQSTKDAKYLYFGDPGVAKKFYNKGNGIYTLNVDFSSPWGFLVRTVNGNEWPANTKYGGKGAANVIQLGVPFRLYNSSNNNDVLDVQMPGSVKYHSHFWTNWFADLNYGAVDTCEKSNAFKAITDAAKIWIDAGIDGLRLDAVKHIYHNERSSENPLFLKKFYNELNTYFRKTHSEDIYMVGEVFSDASAVAQYYQGLPALFEFSFWWKLKDAINGGKGSSFANEIISYQAMYQTHRSDYIEATKLSNHDEVRVGSDFGKMAAKEKLAGAVLLTSGGEPYIYYGEELGYYGEKTNGDEYVRAPMYWGDSYTTTYTDKIDASMKSAIKDVPSQIADTASVYSVYNSFAKARNIYPALSHGKMIKHPSINENSAGALTSVAAWYRVFESERALVFHNMSSSAVTFNIEDPLRSVIARQGGVYIRSNSAGVYQLRMDGYSSVVFELYK